MADLGTLGATNIAALTGALLMVVAVVFLVLYVYSAITLMIIAKKTKTKYAWLAWIPLANLYLMTQIGGVPWWTILFVLLAFVPILGSLIVLGLTIWWWWKIAEARKMPGWLGILMAVPVVNLVVMGYIAWAK